MRDGGETFLGNREGEGERVNKGRGERDRQRLYWAMSMTPRALWPERHPPHRAQELTREGVM